MTQPQVRYLICTTPRSGSSYLCDLISQTEQLGMRPMERQRYERLKPLTAEGWGVDTRGREPLELLEQAFAESATSNGVAGFKVMWHQLRQSLRVDEPGSDVLALERQVCRQTRFIWLRRRSQERQAISLIKAIQSDVWRHGAVHKRGGAWVYDFPGIASRSRGLRRQDASWQAFFERNAVDPLVLYYEDYLQDVAGTLVRISERLGVELSAPVSAASSYQPQSDAINEEWFERYERDSRSVLRSCLAVCGAVVSPRWWASSWRRMRLGR